MYHSTTRRFHQNRLREHARTSRRQAKVHEEIVVRLEGMLSGDSDLRDEVIYGEILRNKAAAQEMWDDHNDAYRQLKEARSGEVA